MRELEDLGMFEETVLLIKGASRIMRFDLSEEELRRILSKGAEKNVKYQRIAK